MPIDNQPSYDQELDYLTEYGSQDWVGMSVLAPVAVAEAGRGATFDAQIEKLLLLVEELIERGIVPGDLTDADPPFVPWPGGRKEVLARLESAVRELGELPDTGEICWLHKPEV